MARRGKGFPVSRRRAGPFAPLAQDQAGLFPQLANRCHAERVHHVTIAILDQAAGTGVRDRADQRNISVLHVNSAAGKDEFVGHEDGRSAALSHENLWRGGPITQGDHSGGVANLALVNRDRLGHRRGLVC